MGWKWSKVCVFYCHDESIEHFYSTKVQLQGWYGAFLNAHLINTHENITAYFVRWIESCWKENEQLVMVVVYAMI